MNRKLIRPNMGEIKERMGKTSLSTTSSAPTGSFTGEGSTNSGNNGNSSSVAIMQGASGSRRKIAPPEQTNAENFYYLKQMQTKTPMVIVLQDGEKIRGAIEWYDKHCLKITRAKEPNILLPKHNIKYLYKQEEEPRIRRIRPDKKDDESGDSSETDTQTYD
ncbi:MAG: RNA chaperone Hfq [Holophagales bacterium]|nr:RNA chaperone Hfq [Holophagales bacterium]